MNNLKIIISLSLLFSACLNPQKKALNDVMDLELKLKYIEDAQMNPELAQDVVEAYVNFVNAFPEAPENDKLLFKCGEVLEGLQLYSKAIAQFNLVYKKHPSSQLAPIAMFRQAYCLELLGQKKSAKNTYEIFIERYPEHQYVDQALGMIRLLNYTDDSLIKVLEN